MIALTTVGKYKGSDLKFNFVGGLHYSKAGNKKADNSSASCEIFYPGERESSAREQKKGNHTAPLAMCGCLFLAVSSAVLIILSYMYQTSPVCNSILAVIHLRHTSQRTTLAPSRFNVKTLIHHVGGKSGVNATKTAQKHFNEYSE